MKREVLQTHMNGVDRRIEINDDDLACKHYLSLIIIILLVCAGDIYTSNGGACPLRKYLGARCSVSVAGPTISLSSCESEGFDENFFEGSLASIGKRELDIPAESINSNTENQSMTVSICNTQEDDKNNSDSNQIDKSPGMLENVMKLDTSHHEEDSMIMSRRQDEQVENQEILGTPIMESTYGIEGEQEDKSTIDEGVLDNSSDFGNTEEFDEFLPNPTNLVQMQLQDPSEDEVGKTQPETLTARRRLRAIFRCEECGKTFSSAANLETHQKTHLTVQENEGKGGKLPEPAVTSNHSDSSDWDTESRIGDDVEEEDAEEGLSQHYEHLWITKLI